MDSHDKDDWAPSLDAEHSARIRELNDKFRRDRQGGYFCLTRGVAELGPERCAALLKVVADFEDFTPENDPYCEHDFGALTFAGKRFLWKIDYYDKSQTWASPDPGDASVTLRFLTVMLASEY